MTVFTMEPEEFLSTYDVLIPHNVMTLSKAEWTDICTALHLSSDGSVAELMTSVFIEKGKMLELLRTGRRPEHIPHKEMTSKTEGVLAELIVAMNMGNNTTRAMLQRSIDSDEQRHQKEIDRLQRIVSQSEKPTKPIYKLGILRMPNFQESEEDLENYITRFEALASSLELTGVQKVYELVSHLRWKSLDTYTKFTSG